MISMLVLAIAVAGLAAYTLWQARTIEARYPPAGIVADVAGQKIHFTDQQPDRPAKATLLLIHGASGNEADMRVPLAKQLLARDFRVISIDRPGLGWSERNGDPDRNSPAGQARIIRAALQKHGVGNVIAVVHSLAGATGLQLALDHDDFVRGIVLISPVTHPWPGGIAAYYSIAASDPGRLFNYTLALPLGQMLLQSGIESVFAPQQPPPRYAQRTGLPLILRPWTFRANARDVAGLYGFVSRQWPRYEQITIPTAIIAGDADKIVLTDVHARNSARQIPGATLTIVTGAGHTPHWTHTSAVLAEIERVRQRVQAALPAHTPMSSR
jgi:pimeloyl-ACP methyl ester carboxylesterase